MQFEPRRLLNEAIKDTLMATITLHVMAMNKMMDFFLCDGSRLKKILFKPCIVPENTRVVDIFGINKQDIHGNPYTKIT